MNILLVDDEQLQLIRLENELKKALEKPASIFPFSKSKEALLKANEIKIDIAFLDIEMPGMNGIILAKELKKINPLTNIIFVTAYNNYALDAYKLHASGYLTKPVNFIDIKEELHSLRYETALKKENKLQIKCFGNFEIFHNGEVVKFFYKKSKELFAYLVDREGSEVNINELNAILWEEDHKSYLRNLIADIQKTMKSINCSDVFIKKRNGCYIDINKVDCDAYEYKRNNPDAIRLYRGEYMAQYSWAIFNN